jgi:hypothetical protein
MPINIRKRAGDLVRGSWVGDHPSPPDETSVAQAYFDEPRSVHDVPSQAAHLWSWIEQQTRVKRDRKADIELYHSMDDSFAEISSALDAYADNATQVGVSRANAARGADQIVQVVSSSEPLREFLMERFARLRLDARAWPLARDMCKLGEVFEEAVVNQSLHVDRMKQLPSMYMVRNEDEYGVLDPKIGYYQLDETFERKVAEFEPWEVVHYRLLDHNERRYGRSILHPIRRVFKQLQIVEDSMVMARLTRGWSKLVYVIDTGTMPPPMAHEHVEKIKAEHKKRRLVDYRGQLRSDLNPLMVEEDIFLALGKGGQSRVDQLYGDLNIGNLSDVEYLQNKMFGGLKVPKAYLAIERDVNSRATVTNQDIQFARTVRRIQMAMRAGHHQTADLLLILEGNASLRREIERETFSIALPAMQTVDEFREWETMRVQSQVASAMMTQLWVDPEFVLTYVFGFSEQQAKKIFLGEKSPLAKLDVNTNSQKSFSAGTDKKIGATTKDSLDLTDPRVMESIQSLLEAVATDDRDGVTVLADLKWMLDEYDERRRHHNIIEAR